MDVADKVRNAIKAFSSHEEAITGASIALQVSRKAFAEAEADLIRQMKNNYPGKGVVYQGILFTIEVDRVVRLESQIVNL